MFTHLVEYDEYYKTDKKLANRLLKQHDKILGEIINSFNGRIVKHMENRIFAEFKSATDSVKCSIAMHTSLKKTNSQNPETFQMNVRVGIHMAEVYEKDGDLFGEGVNLAARIEPISKYGATVTTQAIYNSIRSEKNIFIRDMGRVSLKNIKEPERLFKVYNDEIEYNKETSEELTKKLIKKGVQLVDKIKTSSEVLSVAVLYLKNLGSEDNEFFCYGITEDLILDLSKVSRIKIPLINKIIKFKDQNIDNSDLAAELNVRYVINGNIMKMGDNFRLSLQLDDCKINKNLWSESWESNINKQGLRSKVVIKILNSIGAEIPKSLTESLKKDEEVSPEAYELFLKGRYLSFTSKNKVDKEIVMGLYKKSIKMDRNFINPRWYYAFSLLYNNEHERAVDVLDDALIIAKKNNDISGIAGIKNCYGVIYQNWGRYEQAISNFEEALEIRAKEKNLQEEAKVLNGIGQNYVALNNFEKSFECYNRSLEIKRELDDKNGIAISLANMSINYRRCGDYAKAIEYSNEAMELFNELNNLLFESRMKMNLGLYQVFVGYIEQAEKNLKESLKFLLDIDDFKSSGMCYRGLGLVELNNKNWSGAQNAFKKALSAHQKAEHRPAFEGTTLFLGLAYYYDENYTESEKYIDKSVQITSMRKNISFYGTTAIAAQLMLYSKIEKCKESDIDNLVEKIEKTVKSDNEESESAWMAREYWYISEAYSNLSVNDKSEIYRKKSNKHLESVSLLISDEKIRKDYINLPLLHQLITGKEVDIFLSKPKKKESVIDDEKSNKESPSSTVFAFCPNCGFNNSNQFKFCPQCGSALTN